MQNENHLEAINKRLEILLLVLQYDSQKTNYFSVFERMQINQERASKFDYINYLFRQLDHTEVRMFSVPEIIENKIHKIITAINQTNWEPQIITFNL